MGRGGVGVETADEENVNVGFEQAEHLADRGVDVNLGYVCG